MKSRRQQIRILAGAGILLAGTALGVAAAQGTSSQPAQPSSTTPSVPAPESLEARIARIEAKVESYKESSDKLYQMFEALGALATILIAAVGVLQIVDRRRESERFEDLRKELEDRNSKNNAAQESQRKELFDAAQKNIGQATELFRALTDMLEVQHKAAQIEERLKGLQDKADAQSAVRRSVLADQNRLAIDIWGRVTRGNYVSIENQEKFHEFSTRLRSRQEEYDIKDEELNAACYLIAGLDLRQRDYTERQTLLSKAGAIGRRDVDGPGDNSLRAQLSDKEFRGWSRRCTNEALYHLAILFYNHGDYTRAVDTFQEAVTFDPTGDFVSRMYVPEARFLGGLLSSFEPIAAEFSKLAGLIKEADFPSDRKADLLSLLYVRFGNCYYARSRHAPYLAHRSLSQALDLYKEAYKQVETSYLAQFSYAQALAMQSKLSGQASSEAIDLFKRVVPIVREKLTATVEPKIRMMLYYMLAICVTQAHIEGELPQTYLAQILSEKANLGNAPLRIFSPRTKNDLSVAEFMAEVHEFQSSLAAA